MALVFSSSGVCGTLYPFCFPNPPSPALFAPPLPFASSLFAPFFPLLLVALALASLFPLSSLLLLSFPPSVAPAARNTSVWAGFCLQSALLPLVDYCLRPGSTFRLRCARPFCSSPAPFFCPIARKLSVRAFALPSVKQDDSICSSVRKILIMLYASGSSSQLSATTIDPSV